MTEAQRPLKVGDSIRVIIEDNPVRAERKFDTAKVIAVKDNGVIRVECKKYLGTSNDGTNQQSKVWMLSHFENWEMADYKGE